MTTKKLARQGRVYRVATLQNELAYSVSRARTLDYCARRYYWQYYGSWNGWESWADDTTAKAYRLKKLATIRMIAGTSVHRALAAWLRRIELGAPASSDEVAHHSLEAFDRDITPKKCWEAHLESPDLDQATRRARRDIEILVRRTLATPLFSRLAKCKPDDILYIDSDSFEDKKFDGDGLTVWAAPDAIINIDSCPTIFDWKIGKQQPWHKNQLQASAWFAVETLDVDVDVLKGRLEYLETGESITVQFDANALLRAGAARDQFMSALLPRLVDRTKNVASIEAFPMTENQGICTWCNFQTMCGRGTGTTARDESPFGEEE